MTERDGQRSLTDPIRPPAAWNVIRPVDTSESQTANGYSTRKTGLHSLALQPQTVAGGLPSAPDVEKSSAMSSWMLLSGDEFGENASTRLLHNVNRRFGLELTGAIGLEPHDSFPGAGVDRPESLINCDWIRSKGERQRIVLVAFQMMPAETSDKSSTSRNAIGLTKEKRFLKSPRIVRNRLSARTIDLLGTTFDHAGIKRAANHTHELLQAEKTRHPKRCDMLTSLRATATSSIRNPASTVVHIESDTPELGQYPYAVL